MHHDHPHRRRFGVAHERFQRKAARRLTTITPCLMLGTMHGHIVVAHLARSLDEVCGDCRLIEHDGLDVSVGVETEIFLGPFLAFGKRRRCGKPHEQHPTNVARHLRTMLLKIGDSGGDLVLEILLFVLVVRREQQERIGLVSRTERPPTRIERPQDALPNRVVGRFPASDHIADLASEHRPIRRSGLAQSHDAGAAGCHLHAGGRFTDPVLLARTFGLTACRSTRAGVEALHRHPDNSAFRN